MGRNRLPLAVSPDEHVCENYGSRKGLAFEISNLRRIACHDGSITVVVDFHVGKLYQLNCQIAAILRARVRRAMDGFIPRATKAA